MRAHHLICVLPLVLLFAATSLSVAQEPATITIRKGDTVAISLAPISGSLGTSVSQVLENDLRVIGLFSLTSPERASFRISGQADQGRLNGLVTDSSGAVVLRKTYSGPPRSLAHQFADDIVNTLTGQRGIATTQIAFVSDRSGHKEIYLADYDGAGIRQLTSDRAISVAPALSPNRRFLAYTGYQSGYADIYLIDLASGARRRIAAFPGTNSGAAFSPDSSLIAFTASRDGNPELYTMSALGGSPTRLTRTRGVESSPSWSPDGRQIVYVSDDRGSPLLHRIASSGGIGSVIPTGFAYNTEPDWSPDGSKIAFTVRSGGFSIAIKDIRTGAVTIAAPNGTNPSWAPNSRHLIYASSSGSSIILLDTQTGRSYPIVTGLGRVSEPSWSR